MTTSSPSTTATQGIDALLTHAAVVPLGAQAGPAAQGGGWISVTGSDRVRWLNGMVTNSVQALTPGEGAYTFLLSAQGRIQGDATVWAEPDRLLLQTDAVQVEPMLALLDRFIIMDDVELTDVSAGSTGLLVAGPAAADELRNAGIAEARDSRLLKRRSVPWQGLPLVLITAYSPLVPRFEVWSEHESHLSELMMVLQSHGAAACTQDDVELLRIAEGLPRFGRDIRDRELPQETGQNRALHFSKGCYLGQEIVERIRSRGNVHRTFARFALAGSIPAPGTPLFADGKQVGELTSVAAAQIGGERLALGFIRRETLERGLPLTFEGGTAEPRGAAAAS